MGVRWVAGLVGALDRLRRATEALEPQYRSVQVVGRDSCPIGVTVSRRFCCNFRNWDFAPCQLDPRFVRVARDTLAIPQTMTTIGE